MQCVMNERLVYLKQVQNENDELQSILIIKNAELTQMKVELNLVKDQMQNMKRTIDTLQDEKKEYEMTINELKGRIQELKKKVLDINKFMEWDSNDVINWVLSIDNGVLIKYEEQIKQKILLREVEGRDLVEMDMDDIERLGITKFAHQKLLRANIEKLIQINNNERMVNCANNEVNNEGIANPPTAYI